MKKLFMLLVIVSMSCAVMAQTVIFSDNFDSYPDGAYLAQTATGTAWTTWSDLPGSLEDGIISSAQASSTPNSVYITGQSDVIYPFSNQTSGAYIIEFDYYVPSTGGGSYFNIQHYYTPGTEWAFECFTSNSGTGYVRIGGSDYNFSYPQDAWFHIASAIDLDEDSITITINDVEIGTWPFHYTADGTNGICQLGSIDFFAGAPGNATGTYYFDNFVYTEVSAAAIGNISVTPESVLNANINSQEGGTTSITLNNTGTGPLDYRVVPTFVVDETDASTTDPTELFYYIDEYTTISLTSGAQWEAGIGFPTEDIQNYIGKHISQVQVKLSDSLLTDTKIRIYKMGNLITPGPGTMVYEQPFDAVDGWNTVTLTTPYYLDGGDFWVSVYIDQPLNGGGFCVDGGISGPYGNWVKLGPGWQRLVDVSSSFPYAWCMKVVVEGNPMTPWLALSPTEGTLNAGGSQTVNINVTASNEIVEKTGYLHVYSTDFENPEIDITVNINFVVSIDEYNQINVTVYPNPADRQIQIDGQQINTVEIFNMNGQLMYADRFANNHVTIDAADFAAGTYFVKVTSGNTSKTHKVVVRH